MTPRRRFLRWAGTGAGLLALGWKAPRSDAATPTTDTSSRLALVRGHRLVVREPNGEERDLLDVGEHTFLGYPAWSADGRWIAYAQATIDVNAPESEWGDAIDAASVDGGAVRRLVERDRNGALVQGMCCTPDGMGLLFGYHATLVQNGRFAGRVERIERLNLETGTRATLIEGALFPTITRDGRGIAYMTQDDRGRVSLWVAGADGSDARVAAELGPRFLVVLTPRISPDGSRIVFSAAVQSGVARRANPEALRGLDLGPAGHGLPMDLFQASVADGTVTRLTTFGEDEPYPAWSTDGNIITILATGGLYELKTDGGEPHRIGPGEFGGQIDAR